ncbi:MAG: BMP family ABC transporter substrate-binding protein [Alphaproteobacteria bacterium]|nr:BMP family ABC transporter substrate-binding protein [Alphaproteobacteria bacterium]
MKLKSTIQSTVAACVMAFVMAPAAHAEIKSIVYVSPSSIGVNPFLIMGKEGTEAAAKKIGATATTVESDTQQSKLENVSAAANDGADVVVVLGFEFNDIIADVAPTQPETEFLVVDSCPPGDRLPNVHCAVFREYESAFLMGVIAAMNSKTGKVGTVGALDIPFMHRFSDGFAMGAAHVNPDITVETRWVGGQSPFSDPVRSKEQSLALKAAGVDVIFAAAAGGNFGIYEAAKEAEFTALAVDVNHCPKAPGLLWDSALKRVDEVIMQSIDKISNSEKSTFAAFGIAENGVGAVASSPDDVLAASECLVVGSPDTVAKVREVAAQIASGDLKIEDPMFAKK